MTPEAVNAKLRQLHSHLEHAVALAYELQEYLPLVAAGGIFIEWDQLQWMAVATEPPEE